MSETVVHVTTLDQWNSVLDIWFKQGYSWYASGTEYKEWYFRDGKRFLLLDNDNDIITPSHLDRKIIEYSEFMAQQKEDKEVKTYYVTQEQLELIEDLKSSSLPLYRLVNSTTNRIKSLAQDIPDELERPLLRYLGGDETIEFKIKEQLYRLFRVDDEEDTVYMELNSAGTPDWGVSEISAFKAPLEEIKKWQTPAWEIEKAD